MLVKELIEKLEACDPMALVYIESVMEYAAANDVRVLYTENPTRVVNWKDGWSKQPLTDNHKEIVCIHSSYLKFKR